MLRTAQRLCPRWRVSQPASGICSRSHRRLRARRLSEGPAVALFGEILHVAIRGQAVTSRFVEHLRGLIVIHRATPCDEETAASSRDEDFTPQSSLFFAY